MRKPSKKVTLHFDRKKQVKKDEDAAVEICVALSGQRKYFTLKRCTTKEWKTYQNSDEVQKVLKAYTEIIDCMALVGEELTIENFCKKLEHVTPKKESKKALAQQNILFWDFIEKQMKKENLKPGTFKRKMVVVRSLIVYGKLKKFTDLTPLNLRLYDDWLHDGTRDDCSIHSYHKVVKQYCRIAYEHGYIKGNPYDICHFTSGHCKERRPLSEEELVKMREAKLDGSLTKVRDLFIFSAYTGLAYSDTQNFDYKTMVEQCGDMMYIDGSRVKNGNNYYTPILPPAMDVLRRYNYELPKISNQKANQYLHLIEKLLEFNKPLTTHVARHSFATLSLTHNIPIEKLARMMGHNDIATTQIYGKILKKNITDLGRNLADSLK